MNTPPLLLGATLLYWGWQAGCRELALALALALESSRWLPTRWELEQRDFDRLWNFCAALFLAAVVYAITTGNGPHILGGWSTAVSHEAGLPTLPDQIIRAQLAFIQWWPLTIFPFVLGQAWARSPGVDWGTFSLFLRKRRDRAAQPARPRRLLLFHLFFPVCLGCACIGQPAVFVSFPALALLLAWALWGCRPRRFAWPVWGVAVLLATSLGFVGHLGLRHLHGLAQSHVPWWFQRGGGDTDDAREARTAIGHAGRLKLSGKILYRVEPPPGLPPPELLREAGYTTFKSPSWLAPGSTRDFKPVMPGMDEGAWILRRPRSTDRVVGLAGLLPRGRGLLPVPIGVARIEHLPALGVTTNRFGAIRVEEGPGFFRLDCWFGSGHGGDSAPDAADLAVPPEEAAAVAAVAEELGLADVPAEEALRRVRRFFEEHYSYSLERGPRVRGGSADSPITRFLGEVRVGHCEHFATATVLLLRRAGIPARYAVGFAVQERSGTGYVVRSRHAHAWCLVHLEGAWQDFDTTPSSWVESDARRAGAFEFLADWWSRLRFEFEQARHSQSWLRRYAGWLAVLLLLLAGLRLVWGRRGRALRLGPQPPAVRELPPGLDSELYEIEREMTARGFARPPGENFKLWLGRLARAPELGTLQPALTAVLALHNRLRFDPLGLPPDERQALRQQSQAALLELRGAGQSRR